MKKTLLWLAAGLVALAVTVPPVFADSNPWEPPGKTASALSTALRDSNPWEPPGK
jgi:hypothetical protein